MGIASPWCSLCFSALSNHLYFGNEQRLQFSVPGKKKSLLVSENQTFTPSPALSYKRQLQSWTCQTKVEHIMSVGLYFFLNDWKSRTLSSQQGCHLNFQQTVFFFVFFFIRDTKTKQRHSVKTTCTLHWWPYNNLVQPLRLPNTLSILKQNANFHFCIPFRFTVIPPYSNF